MTGLRIFLLAAGRVGQALGLGFSAAGLSVEGLWRRTESEARSAAARLGVSSFWGFPLPVALSAVDVVILSPPERVVESLARAVAPLLAPGAVLLHTAGSLPPVEGLSVASGVLHPLQSIAEAEQGARALRGAFFAISGEPRAQGVAAALARALGGRPVEVRDATLYHLGAVLASNSLYPLFAAALDLFAQAGIESALAAEMLLPLVRGSVENLASLGPARGLTGPIARADPGTIDRHLRALSEKAPALLPLYTSLAARALPLAEENGADPRGLSAIASLLAAAETAGPES